MVPVAGVGGEPGVVVTVVPRSFISTLMPETAPIRCARPVRRFSGPSTRQRRPPESARGHCDCGACKPCSGRLDPRIGARSLQALKVLPNCGRIQVWGGGRSGRSLGKSLGGGPGCGRAGLIGRKPLQRGSSGATVLLAASASRSLGVLMTSWALLASPPPCASRPVPCFSRSPRDLAVLIAEAPSAGSPAPFPGVGFHFKRWPSAVARRHPSASRRP